ncbi:hypothetical protein GCM10010869_30570 [Mesorhizobium tianshanense]|uniref:Putative esterase n=1 Tax=Mesorhizobium tianshanense TaxID=39844 RepID=A0A562P7G8_9HYPH|nr:putative esterase [Mesorhizobium tianshanense]GLS37463.1 hypothetical protein GCM10010869_30570 [Mesorhizobium tianshanense]
MAELISTPALIADTTVHDLAPAHGGEPYRIFLHVPAKPAPQAGWPVLYMTDGNDVIGTAVDAVRAQAGYPLGTNVEDGVIVAIGYPLAGAYDPLRRSWDLGPPPGKTYPPFHDGGPEVRTGGAEDFLAFIEGELKPWVAGRARIDIGRQALYGHSFGGLFALYALFTRPLAFRTWVAASPAIYWEDRAIDHFLHAFEAAVPDGLRMQVILSAGEYETEKLAPFQIGAAGRGATPGAQEADAHRRIRAPDGRAPWRHSRPERQFRTACRRKPYVHPAGHGQPSGAGGVRGASSSLNAGALSAPSAGDKDCSITVRLCSAEDAQLPIGPDDDRTQAAQGRLTPLAEKGGRRHFWGGVGVGCLIGAGLAEIRSAAGKHNMHDKV